MTRTATVAFAVATASFAQTYSVVPIPAPSGFTNVTMIGIDNSGRVAGTGCSGMTTQAFVGSLAGSTMIPLPVGWTSASGVAINVSGRVAGTISNATTSAAFIGTASGSAVIPLPPPPYRFGGFSSYSGFALNDSGQVAGTLNNLGFGSPAFIGTTSGSTPLPLPGAGGTGRGRGSQRDQQLWTSGGGLGVHPLPIRFPPLFF